jgi:linoleoyl-CoA desaturase
MNQPAPEGAGAWTETSGRRAVPAVFPPTSGFQTELRKQVDAYFRATGKRRRDLPMMYVKTAFLLAWWGASYWLLMFHQHSALEAVLLSISLGLALAGIGFNVAHDACHGAYSRRSFVNQCMGYTLDLVGGSSYVWKRKHNYLHHTYTNVAGADDDIDFGYIGRLSPDQPLRGLHRYQHLYLWLLYGGLAIAWQYHDVTRLLRGRIGPHIMERPRRWELAAVIIGKALFVTVMFVIPALFHPLGTVLLYFGIAYFTLGLTMAVVFQLAHCVEITAFPNPPENDGRMDHEWAVHQIETTANFARSNPLLTWYLGGLNYQVEHHLFPKISHLHYPALSGIVERSCARFGIRYLAHRTLFEAIASHYRFLRRSDSHQPA